MSQRICCLQVPMFSLAARLRSEPDLHGEALAIFEGNGNRASLIAATRRARLAGLKPGMKLPQARALLPKLLVRARDEECERAAGEALLEICSEFSPRVEDARSGIVYLDISGTGRRFPSDQPEHELASTLLLATEASGLPAWAGVASSKLAARMAAGRPPTPRIVPPREEAAFLAPLPLDRLCPESEVHETLRRWGLATIGDFAALPHNQVVARLGDSGQRLHEKARGLDIAPLVPTSPPPTFHEGMDLDWPLLSVEPFLFVASTALDRLCKRLEVCGLACTKLEMTLRLDPSGFDNRSVLLPAPTREAKTLLTLTRLDLERSAPGAPVTGFTFTAHPDRPRCTQLALFGPAALSPERLATTLARLFALLGAERVGSPGTVDTHRPAAFRLDPFTPPDPPEQRSRPARGKGLLAVRALRPPIPLEVETASNPDGPQRPVRVRCAYDDEEEARKSRLEIQGRVYVASGPWSVDDDWWTERPRAREYWDVELAAGSIYRLFRDAHTGSWYADGMYD